MKLCMDCKHSYYEVRYFLAASFPIREIRCKFHKVPVDIARRIDGYCDDAKDFEPTLWYKFRKLLRLV